MNDDITTQAVRLAMSMSQMRAEVAGVNIAQASSPGAQATRLDFGRSQGLLEQLVGRSPSSEAGLLSALSDAAFAPNPGQHKEASVGISLDEEVADMASANLKYQALTESLNRHFGLMRLAISGRN